MWRDIDGRTNHQPVWFARTARWQLALRNSSQPQRYVGRGQVARSHQEHVDGACRPSPLVDRPYNERLAAAAIAAGENFGGTRRKLGMLRFVIRPRIAVDADHFADVLLWPFEAHRQQHELGRPELVGARQLLQLPL